MREKKFGISLVEMILAVTIIGFSMMILFNLFYYSAFSARHAEYRLEAVNIAQSILEEIRCRPFNDFNEAEKQNEIEQERQVPVKGEPTYICKPTIFNVKDETGAEMDSNFIKGIGITVSWKEKIKEYSIYQEAYVCNIQR